MFAAVSYTHLSELANELGKTSKEVLDIIKQKDSSASLFAASSVSKDQETMVRNAVSQKKEGAPKAEAEKAEPAKKKLTAVFRPQNAKQQIKRPVPKEQPKPQQAVPKAEETKPVQAAEAKPQVQETSAPAVENRPAPVSYTHLDVYKRQTYCFSLCSSSCKESAGTDA